MAKDTTPLEEFRRVTATTMRAISRHEVNVSFVPDGGSLLGNEARITVPARDLPVEDVSRVRGEADSMALKLRHHDRIRPHRTLQVRRHKHAGAQFPLWIRQHCTHHERTGILAE